MALTTDIQSTVAQQAQRIAGAPERIVVRHVQVHNEIMHRLLALEREIVHVRTGRLRAGLAIQGPFTISAGTLEGQISAPSVPYAADEAKLGGAHDFARRTMFEGAAILNEYLSLLEAVFVQEIGAGPS